MLKMGNILCYKQNRTFLNIQNALFGNILSNFTCLEKEFSIYNIKFQDKLNS